MKKLVPSFIAVTVWAIIFTPNSYAADLTNKPSNQQCLVDVPIYNRPVIKDDINRLPVEVSSDNFEARIPNQAIYRGNVAITQGNRSVISDHVTIDAPDNDNRNMILKGGVLYQDNLVEMRGTQASMNLNSNDVLIQNSQYNLVGRLGRGTADNMQFTDNRYIILHDGSFTSCPVNDSSWNIEGSTIILDNKEELLEVWNAVFRIGKVPVLYSPYLQLPTGDKRRSGLLMPEFSYNSIDGIDFSLPFYWNIAPNYDATLTPRVIQRRGLQLQTEFRYLNPIGLGTLAFDWLGHDSLYNQDRHDASGIGYSNNDYRWLFHWKNDELINENWRFTVDATRVSDNQYLSDLGSNYASETDGYLTQLYKVGYTDESWDIGLSYEYFQALVNGLKDNLYHTEPQLDIKYYNNDMGPFNFRTFGQVSHFVSAGDNNPKTWRFYVEPTLGYTLLSSWAVLNTEASFMATHYNQDIPNSNKNDNLQKNVNRFMPKLSIDGKIIFERDVDTLDGYTQTLEPRVKYTYIPYRNQSDVLNYDSSLLQSDYIGLFRDLPYSGLDRISSANKIATGLTTRFYDINKVERFNFSLGQIYYFTQSRTGDHQSPLDQNDDTGSVTWATDTYWRVNDDIIVRTGMQYDTRINEISLANAIFEYRSSSQKIVQFSYRYANKNYIDAVGFRDNEVNYKPHQQDIAQLGLMSAWPLTETVSAVGSYFYDVKIGQTTDAFVGLHYSDCCWGIGIQYGRKITDWDINTERSQYENKLSINFELRGLGRDSNTIAKMLDFGLLPYKTAFEEDNGTN